MNETYFANVKFIVSSIYLTRLSNESLNYKAGKCLIPRIGMT